MYRSALLSLAIIAGAAALAPADEILFKNGDRLTGKITTAADGKLTIKTAVAGDVTVNMADVKTFSTDEPIEIHTAGGSVLKQKVVASPQEGAISTQGGDVQGQPLPIATVKTINPPPAPPVKWTGSLVLNSMFTRGNSDSDNIGFTFDASRRTEQDRITLGAGYLYGRQRAPDTGEKVTTTDNWFLLAKYDYFFNKKFYAYGNGRIERDRIAELNLRFTPGAGLGYQWIEGPNQNFFTEAGVSWVYEDYENADSQDHIAARFAYHFDKKLNDKVTFFHNLEYLPSVEEISDFNLNTDAGLRAALTARMFAELKVEWRHDSEPAPDAAKNDLRYLVGVGWMF